MNPIIKNKPTLAVNSRQRYGYLVGAVALILCAFVILWRVGLPKAPNFVIADGELLEIAVVGGRVPAFEAQTIRGENLVINGNMGHPLIINFWATWCDPCIREMPVLENLFVEGIPVLGVNTGLEDRETIVEWADGMGLTFPILDDDDTTRQLETLYRIRPLPTTFFIDQNGIIQYIQLGALTEDTLAKGLEAIRPQE